MKISPARISAFEILLKIQKEKAFSSILLPHYAEKLSLKDRSLCHQLTLGVLRHKLYLEKIITQFSAKKLDEEVRIALQIGLYQMIFLDKIPISAVVNESVNLVDMAKKKSAKGFVNAVLRRYQREKPELKFKNQTEKLAVETSHPLWLVEKWIKDFGQEKTEKLCLANNLKPHADFRWTAKTTEAVKKSLEKEETRKDKAFLRELAENGKIYFQDKGSQIIGEMIEVKESERFLDVCSAPGSKLTQVAVKHQEKCLFGGDVYFQRLRNLRENCRKQGVKNVEVVQFDAEKSLPFSDESFDVLLVDVPCSGTGTLKNNPEIKYELKETDFAELKKKQLTILRNASKLLKKGGKLIYSTCSLEKEENEEVVEEFLQENKKFEVEKPNLSEVYLNEKGFARIFPLTAESDGFFIAKLTKTK